ncbi:MAG: hypothetical protein ABI300_06645 [Rhodanobacter sp.]
MTKRESPPSPQPPQTGRNMRSSARGAGMGRFASSADEAAASGDTGWIRGAVTVPGPSLDDAGGEHPHDGRAHQGLSGDDAAHRASGSSAVPASGSTGAAADLGRVHDPRQPISNDPAELTTGGDRPNDGGRMTGAAGGPGPTAPSHLPGSD